MKLVDLHKAQVNVGPHTKKRMKAQVNVGPHTKKRMDLCAGRGRQIKLENWTLKINLAMGLLQHGETWLVHTQQPLVDDRSFFEYLVPL